MDVLAGPALSEVRDALAAAGSRTAAMFRHVADPARPAIGTWSIGETAAHLAGSSSLFLAIARGERPPERLDEVAVNNAAYLRGHPERDPRVLADQLQAGEAALLAYVDGLDDDAPLELFEGADSTMSTLLAVELGEVLVHGRDVARAAGLPWAIPRGEAAIAVRGMLTLLPAMVDEEATAGLHLRYDVHIRSAARLILAFDDGQLHLEAPSAATVDCHISADPRVFLLLSFGRITPWTPMLRGRLTAWGRRFWLGARFPALFRTV